MNKSAILYLFTRTPLHVGAGASVGAMDQPVQRERPTGFPIIPGSSIKGVLRDAVERDPQFGESRAATIFGLQENAGFFSFGDAKVLAFPIRSARGSFAFITCPLALERFRREHGGLDKLPNPVTSVPAESKDMHCLSGDKVTITRGGQTGVVLEEYRFNLDGPFPPEWEAALLSLLDDTVLQVGQGRFVLLNTGDFSHFVRTACEVNQHVSIDDATGTAKGKALFDLEAVPAETLFFAPLTSLPRPQAMPPERLDEEIKALSGLLDSKKVLQFGGDGTTGLGFCTVTLV